MAFVILATTAVLLSLVVHGTQRVDARVRGTKILGVLSNADVARVLEVRYEPLTHKDAEDDCKEDDGRLAVLKTKQDLAFVDSRLFYSGSLEPAPSDGPIYVPSYYWIGLRKYADEWRYADGTLGSHGSRPLFNQTLRSAERDYECGGVKTTTRDDLVRQRGNCMEKMPYICVFEGTHCVPDLPNSETEDYVSEEERDFDCKNQIMSQLQMVPNNCTCLDDDKHRMDAKDHLSCTSIAKWPSAFCVSGCPVPPTPPGAVLVDPEPHLFTDGSWFTFFCAGYFQISRTVIPTNVHQVQCNTNKSLSDEIQKIKCNPTDSLHINTNVKRLLVELGKVYHLHCDFLGFREIPRPDSVIWVKDGEILDIPTNEKGEGKANGRGNAYYSTNVVSGGHLNIHNFSPESQGTYGCFGRYRNALLPGNVFRLSTDESDIASTASAFPKEHLLLMGVVLLKTFLF